VKAKSLRDVQRVGRRVWSHWLVAECLTGGDTKQHRPRLEFSMDSTSHAITSSQHTDSSPPRSAPTGLLEAPLRAGRHGQVRRLQRVPQARLLELSVPAASDRNRQRVTSSPSLLHCSDSRQPYRHESAVLNRADDAQHCWELSGLGNAKLRRYRVLTDGTCLNRWWLMVRTRAGR